MSFSKLPCDVLFTIALLCDILEGWQLVQETRYEMAYIRRRLPSWKILTSYRHPYPIIWIKEAIKINPPINEYAILWAAKNGHKETVMVLLKARSPVDEGAIAVAARNGNTEIVKLLLAARSPVDEDAIWCAANNGHVEIVKLLLEARSPVDEDAITVADDNDHTEILKLLIEARSPLMKIRFKGLR